MNKHKKGNKMQAKKVYDPFGFKSGHSKFGNTVNKFVDGFEVLVGSIFGGIKGLLVLVLLGCVAIAFAFGLFAHGFVFGVIAIALIALVFK